MGSDTARYWRQWKALGIDVQDLVPVREVDEIVFKQYKRVEFIVLIKCVIKYNNNIPSTLFGASKS